MLLPGLIIGLVSSWLSKMLKTFFNHTFLLHPAHLHLLHLLLEPEDVLCQEKAEQKFTSGSLKFFFSFIGFLLNLLFVCNMPTMLLLERSCCSCKAAIKYGVYKPDYPTKLFILRINKDGSEEVCSADDHEEEADKEETEEQMEMEQTLGQADEEIRQQGEQGEETV